MNYTQFLTTLEKKKPHHLYVISGSEAFLKAEVIRLLKALLGDSLFFKEYVGDNSFNIRSFLNDVYSEPLFEDWNLIILRDGHSQIQTLATALEKYLQAPPTSTVLVIEVNKLDQRTRLAKLIEKKGALVDCKPLRSHVSPYSRNGASELSEWICKRAMHHKKTIAMPAVQCLQEFVGSDLHSLDLQLQKLALFLGQRSEITVDDIRELVGQNRRTDIFALIDAIFNNQKVALPMIKKLFAKGSIAQGGQILTEHNHIALQCLRLLHYRVKQLWKFSVNREVTGIPPFVQRKLKAQAQYFAKTQLMAIWEQLLQTEFALKTSRYKPDFAIEQLAMFIMKSRN